MPPKTKSKYGNTPVTVDRATGLPARPDKLTDQVIHLDSQLELLVYQSLIKDVPYNLVIREPKIAIAKPSALHPRGISYFPDFAVYVQKIDRLAATYPEVLIHIEVKGQPTNAWLQKMRQLETADFETYQSLVVVTNNRDAMPKSLVCIPPYQVRDFIRGIQAHEGSYFSFVNARKQGK